MNKFVRFVVGPLFVGIGGVVVLIIIGGMVIAERSAEWPQVKGKVLTSRVVESISDKGTNYSAKVKYEYEVVGVRYTSDRIKFGARSLGKGSAVATWERYPAESEVTVYYDPEKPSSSVLEQEMEQGSNFFALLVGLVFLGAGIAMTLGLLKTRPSSD